MTKNEILDYCWCRDLGIDQTQQMLASNLVGASEKEIKAWNLKRNQELFWDEKHGVWMG